MRITFCVPHVFTRDSSPTEDDSVARVLRDAFVRVAHVLHPGVALVRSSADPGARALELRGCRYPTLEFDRGVAVWDFGQEVFHPSSSKRDNALALQALMAALVDVNVLYREARVAEGIRVAPLYDAGVRYDRTVTWDSVPTLYAKGFGDCKSLAAALVAERRRAGQEAAPEFRWVRNDTGERDFHILVRTPFGNEDPSKRLGMGAQECAPAGTYAQASYGNEPFTARGGFRRAW